MRFRILGDIWEVQLIAKGARLRERKRLWKSYGRGTWRKLKGIARVELKAGVVVQAELHWYKVHGIGKKEFKIKRIIEEA